MVINMKKKNENDRSVREKLEQDFGVPSDILCGGLLFELRGRGNAVVGGCQKILAYSPNQIAIKTSKDIVVISGKRLTCLTYCAGEVSVMGKIEKIEFSEDEKWRCSNT